MTLRKSYLPYLCAITTSIIFGLSFLFSKLALGTADPFELLSFRFLAAFFLMTILIILKLVKVNYKNKPLKWLIILAITQPVTYFIFETYGIKYSSSSQAGLMIALIPIVVTLLGAYFLNENMNMLQWISIIVSVSGVVLIVIMNNSASSGINAIGTLLLLGAVLSGALFNVLSRKLSVSFSSFELTYFMMGTAALFFNFTSIMMHIKNGNITQYFSPLKNTNFLIAIGYLGILSSIVAFFLINYALSKIEASKSSVFANVSTIVSIIAGVIIFKESFKLYHFIGSTLIILGVWGTNYFSKKVYKGISVNESSVKNAGL